MDVQDSLHCQQPMKRSKLQMTDGTSSVNTAPQQDGIVMWGQLPTSRIYRVSRASGGKDRHSKVYTAKGIRDRRVRLSVSTAIQFYDLQDRLGYDQPSKAIEWLIKAASSAIDKLPTLDFTNFPPGCGQFVTTSATAAAATAAKSGCSSTSETSKGSVLSLSRSETRAKARERARGRAEKDKLQHHELLELQKQQNNVSAGGGESETFTELLTSASAVGEKMTTDFFGTATAMQSHVLQHYGIGGCGASIGMALPFNSTVTVAREPTAAEMAPQFALLQENLAAAGDYNLNFSIASGITGFNRGTLQSNSPDPHLHHRPHRHQNHENFRRPLASTMDGGSQLPFFFAGNPTASEENFSITGIGFNSNRLQLWDGFQQPSADMEKKSSKI